MCTMQEKINSLELENVVGSVYSGNDVEWEFFPQDFVDLWYENFLREMQENGLSEEEIEKETEFWETGEEQLYGDWQKNSDGLYEPNKNGPEEFAAIYDSNTNYMQVIWSKHFRYGRWASPCFPSQVDARYDDPKKADNVCYVKYFALPDDCLRQE